MALTPSAFEVLVEAHKTQLVLRGILDVSNASALHQVALDLNNAGGESPDGSREPGAGPSLHVDMREVEAADVAVLQILAALEAEFTRQGRVFEIHLSAAIERQWQAAGWRGFARS